MEQITENKKNWHGLLVPSLFIAGVIILLVMIKILIL
jgi:hypothetical protein